MRISTEEERVEKEGVKLNYQYVKVLKERNDETMSYTRNTNTISTRIETEKKATRREGRPSMKKKDGIGSRQGSEPRGLISPR